MTKTIKTLVLAITLMSFVLATGSDSVTATENPCKADFDRLCGDVKPGQGRIQACLREHKDEISQECKAFLQVKAEELRDRIEQVADACKGDAERLCKGIEPGEGRILRCLFLHRDQLSEGCKNSVQQ